MSLRKLTRGADIQNDLVGFLVLINSVEFGNGEAFHAAKTSTNGPDLYNKMFVI